MRMAKKFMFPGLFDGVDDPYEYLRRVPDYEPIRRRDVRAAAKAVGAQAVIDALDDLGGVDLDDYADRGAFEAERVLRERAVYDACEAFTKGDLAPCGAGDCNNYGRFDRGDGVLVCEACIGEARV
jgi:hypothetical protein